jgi:hypothetical protein
LELPSELCFLSFLLLFGLDNLQASESLVEISSLQLLEILIIISVDFGKT